MIVEDHGVTRTDAGLLGNGIYFAGHSRYYTVNFGYNDIGCNDISLITTLISCPELFSIYWHTKSFRYNDILNNDTSQITTHISCPKALYHCEYNDKYYSLTVLAPPLKKIARQISRLVPRRHVTKHAPVKNMPA